jgi:caffeoyl-CoA O-methyltransferase
MYTARGQVCPVGYCIVERNSFRFERTKERANRRPVPKGLPLPFFPCRISPRIALTPGSGYIRAPGRPSLRSGVQPRPTWFSADLPHTENLWCPVGPRLISRDRCGIATGSKEPLMNRTLGNRNWSFTAAVLFGILAAIYPVNRLAAQEPSAGNPRVTNDLEPARRAFVEQFPLIGLNSAPGDAAMLRILVQATGAKRGVEVGTATGYGAILMGLGFEQTGGHLITVDIDPKMVAATRANLKKVGLENVVTVIEGDALEVLPQLEGEFDFVYLDAVKSDYLKYFRALEPKLVPGAVIVADNAIRSARAMADFIEAVNQSPDYLSTTIRADDSKRDGMMVIYKLK